MNLRTIFVLMGYFGLAVAGRGANLGSAISYQGRLTDGGNPASGTYDFQFKLHDAVTGGTQVGNTASKEDVVVSNGLFMTELDFGSNSYTGLELWLEIGVRSGSSAGAFTTLSPRQRLAPAPYALYSSQAGSALVANSAATASSLPWSALTGVPAGFADGIDNDTIYTAGTGLSLSGTTFSIANGGVGAAQLATGAVIDSVMADGSVRTAKLADGAVTPTKLSSAGATTGQILKYTGTQWALASDTDTTYTAGTGLALSGAIFSIASGGVSAANLAAGSVTESAMGDGSVRTAKLADGAVTPAKLSSTGATAGQILKYNGTQWAFATDSDTTYTAGAGLNLNANQFSVSFSGAGAASTAARGDHTHSNYAAVVHTHLWSELTAIPAGFADGIDNDTTYGAGAGLSLSGTTFSIANSGVSAAQLADGAVTASKLSGAGATAGQILKYNGTQWALASDNDTTYTAGAGLSLSGNQFSVSYGGSGTAATAARSDHNHDTSYLKTGAAAGGDLSGSYPNPAVSQLQGRAVAAIAPSAGQVLKWNGTQWAPGAESATTYSAGAGLSLSGSTFSIANGGVGTAHLADGAVTLTKLSTTGAAAGQILKYNGTQWALAPDSDTTYTAGPGLNLSMSGGQFSVTFSGTGTAQIAARSDHNHDATYLKNGATAGGDLSGTLPTPTVARLQGRTVASSPPSSGQVLKWDGTQWGPGTDSGASYTAGSGLNLSGTTFSVANPLSLFGSAGTMGIIDTINSASLGYGVRGSGSTGVAGFANTAGGTGVSGASTSGTGVNGTATGGPGVWGESVTGPGVRGISTSGDGLRGQSDTGVGVVAVTSSGIAVRAHIEAATATLFAGSTAGTTVFRVNSSGKGFFNGGTQTGGADVAEFIAVTGEPQAGDVVEIDPDQHGRFRIAAQANSSAVAGVLSTEPGVTLNAKDPADSTNTGPQLALAGRVPVKVSAENGTIRPGDLLVSSGTAGHAMKAGANPGVGTVIGKALGAIDSGKGTIEMLVMLR